MKRVVWIGAFVLAVLAAAWPAAAQAPVPAPENVVPTGVTPPDDYVIGPEDVLEVVFWREKDLSGQVMVRPDGMVSLPLLNDVQAAGLSVEQFRQNLLKAAGRYVENPSAAVIVRTINSRKIFITGEVNKPGAYALGGPMTVVQLLTLAGGFKEYADQKNVAIVRVEDGKTVRHKFNYKDYARGKNTQQDIALKPGDTVIVP